MKIKPSIYATSLSAFLNLVLVYAAYAVCRVAYGLENWSVLGGFFIQLRIARIKRSINGTGRKLPITHTM